MLIKLVKYDLKWLLKIILIFLSLGVLFSFLGRVMNLLPNSIFFEIIKGIFVSAGISLSCSAIVNSIIRPWVRLTNNMYKDESYLTNTLPISRNTHYLSKCISGLICLVISVVVTIINLFILYYSKENILVIKEALNMMSSTLNISVVLFLILVFFVVLLELLFILQCGYFGIIYGHTHNKNKFRNSFMFGLICYMIASIISIIIMVIVSLFDDGLKSIILGGTTVIEFELLKVLMIFASIIYVIYVVALYFINSKILKKGINIE